MEKSLKEKELITQRNAIKIIKQEYLKYDKEKILLEIEKDLIEERKVFLIKTYKENFYKGKFRVAEKNAYLIPQDEELYRIISDKIESDMETNYKIYGTKPIEITKEVVLNFIKNNEK